MKSTRELHTDGNFNKKPFRTKAQKQEAKAKATQWKGAWYSSAPTSRHAPRAEHRNAG